MTIADELNKAIADADNDEFGAADLFLIRTALNALLDVERRRMRRIVEGKIKRTRQSVQAMCVADITMLIERINKMLLRSKVNAHAAEAARAFRKAISK